MHFIKHCARLLPAGPVTKILLVMKLTLVLLTSFILQASAAGYAQTVSLRERNAALETVLKKISQQTGLRLWYQSDVMRKTAPVTLEGNGMPLVLALDQLFKGQPLGYELTENTIVVRERPTRSALPLEAATEAYATVKGTVRDEEGMLLAGASVMIKGTAKGTSTNEKGQFTLQTDSSPMVLVISFIGYETLEWPVSGDSEQLIVLKRKSIKNEEIVVVGYGTQKRSDLTGSVGTVDVKRSLQSRPATNIQELLAGSVPGLNVSKGSGAVGSGASLNIRGTSTIGGSSGVLVLIDGMPGNIYTLNPNDIESISVLKDAASASIYGSRAANGVILVTTKRGKSGGKPVVELITSAGVQQPQFMIDFLGSEDYMRLWDRALVNDGKQPLYGNKGIEDLKAGKYADNLWYKEIYKKNTFISNNTLAISGGNEFATYRISGSYDYQDGTLPNNNYKRYVVKPDVTFKITPTITVGANLQYTETYLRQPNGGTTIWQTQAARAAPISPIYTKNGEFGIGSSMVGNPLADVSLGGFNNEKYKELMAIFDATWTPLPNWNLRGQYARYASDNWTTNRVSTYRLYDDNGNIAAQKNLVPSLSEASSSNWRNMLQVSSDYSRNFGSHNFKVMAGYSQEYYRTAGFTAFRDGMPFDDIHVLDVGSPLNMQNTGTASDVAIQSFFGRLNYSYDDRYLFQANFRADGSSRFAKERRWGYFPSFSAGWNIHREHFFDVSWISQLKLRASWGVLGDAEKIDFYATSTVLAYNPSMYAFNGVLVAGAWNNVAVNKDLRWEESKQTNLALDLGFLNNRINLTAEYFINNRDHILYASPVPSEFGLPAPVTNLLQMENRGFELLASYKDKQGDWGWGADLTFNFSRNKVSDMAGTGPWIDNTTITEPDRPLSLPYGLEAIGLFQSEDEIKKSPNQGPNVFPGNIKYKDQNGDNLIDGKDRIVLNDKPVKRFGGNLFASWKNLDLSANFYGSLTNYRYISSYEGWAFYLSQNARPMHLDNWTPENPNASYPRLTIQYTSNDTKYSSYWLRKANYLKLQNMQLGYSFSPAMLQRLGVAYLRAYLSVQNLATVTNYPGFDPEGGYYPISRTYSIGVNLKF